MLCLLCPLLSYDLAISILFLQIACKEICITIPWRLFGHIWQVLTRSLPPYYGSNRHDDIFQANATYFEEYIPLIGTELPSHNNNYL